MHNKRDISKLGKEYYDFDCNKEKNIYMYLCRKRLSKRKIKRIDNQYKFDKYSQWKQYIYDKYDCASDDSLNEFRHFLNQMLRNNKPEYSIWSIAGTVIMTLVVEYIYDILIVERPWYINAIAYISMVVLMVFAINTILQKFDYSTIQESFYQDYIEIIDEIIKKEKTNTEPAVII